MTDAKLIGIIIGLQVMQLGAGVLILQRITRLETIYEMHFPPRIGPAGCRGTDSENTAACSEQRKTVFPR